MATRLSLTSLAHEKEWCKLVEVLEIGDKNVLYTANHIIMELLLRKSRQDVFVTNKQESK